MRKVRYSEGGEKFIFSPLPSPVVYPESDVQPDQALSIREIYARWRNNQPTSVHPLDFDDDADDIDFDDEMPIDRSMLESKLENLRDVVNTEKEEKKARRRQKKEQESEQDSFIDKLSQKLNNKSNT